MSVTVFEDPCPKLGQSLQEIIDRMFGKKEKNENHGESFIYT